MKLKVTELKKALKDYDKKELIQLITDLYKKNKDVQSYLSVKFLGEEVVVDLFKEAKKKIKTVFFPDKGFDKLRLNVARKAISDFKQLTEDQLRTTELMLYYVEQGVAFTNTYGDINESFYNSMISMYEKVVDECMDNEEVYNKFNERLKKIIYDTEGIGWGFPDGLYYVYSAIANFEDEE